MCLHPVFPDVETEVLLVRTDPQSHRHLEAKGERKCGEAEAP